MSLAAGTRLGSYEIVAPLGEGGMGAVYRARDTKLGRAVAIKVILDEFASNDERVGRFEREAKMLASLHHPRIASLFGLEMGGIVFALRFDPDRLETAGPPVPILEGVSSREAWAPPRRSASS